MLFVCHRLRVPNAIIEMNPETVKREKAKEEPIYYGDSTQEAVLKLANIQHARVVVAAINDPGSQLQIDRTIGQTQSQGLFDCSNPLPPRSKVV
jgi:CPA2 family monovalent cation:H+ antiporter-2